MSDLRVSYTPFDDDPQAFVSQQMQIASVRVVGAESPEQEKAIFDAHRQIISRFFRACDTQHRMAGRGHTQFRMSADGVELRYVNNAGQPLIFVTSKQLMTVTEVAREAPAVPGPLPPPPSGWAVMQIDRVTGTTVDGARETLTGSVSLAGRVTGQTVTQEAPVDSETSYTRMVVFFSDTEIDDPETYARAQFNSDSGYSGSHIAQVLAEVEDVPTVFTRLPAADGPRLDGIVEGYSAADGTGFAAYPTPQPLYALEVGISSDFAAATIDVFPEQQIGIENVQFISVSGPEEKYTTWCYIETWERFKRFAFRGNYSTTVEVVGPYARYATASETVSATASALYDAEYMRRTVLRTTVYIPNTEIVISDTYVYDVTVDQLGRPIELLGFYAENGEPIVSSRWYDYSSSYGQQTRLYASALFASDRWGSATDPSRAFVLAEHESAYRRDGTPQEVMSGGSTLDEAIAAQKGVRTILKLTDIPVALIAPEPQGVVTQTEA